MTKHRRQRTYKLQPRRQKSQFDYLLFAVALLLTVFGVLMVYDASVVEAFRDFSDKFYFARLQAMWAGVGLGGMLLISRIPLGFIKKLSLPIFLGSILLLVLVLVPGFGQEVQGARRWIALGALTLQPSELVKLTFVIYLAHWLEKRQRFWPFMLLSAVILSLVMAQPDLGTSIVVVSSGLAMYFLSGAPLGSLITIGVLGLVSGAIFILTSNYRRQRLLTFLNPTQDPLGSSYHIRQVLIALGSGGLLGVGIGRSRQKYSYLPEATTDSIFAVIAEEIGFLGSFIVILLFLVLLYRGFSIARNAKNPFSQLLAGGITAWLGIQTFLNLSAMVALVPLTGIPLPFISYGGSSLVTALAGIGLLLNVSQDK